MRLFLLSGAVRHDPAIDDWMRRQDEALAAMARKWFEVIRGCGEDVRELMHDGQPTACVGDAAFAYVGAYREHVNVGFFQGAELIDPCGLLEGTGKSMRHVKLRPEGEIDATALRLLIREAYADVKARQSGERR